jgi:signal transduction histidine kinase
MKAAAAVLFELDPAERKVHIVAQRGADAIRKDALLELIYSPVRDVAEDRQFVRIEDADEAAARLRYLRPLLKFGACMGVPIAADLTAMHALFFFWDQPTRFTEVHHELARATALSASAALERREMFTRTAAIQRKALLGDLSWGLVHELNQRIMPATQAIGPLQKQIEAAERALPNTPEHAADQLHFAQRSLQHLSNGVQAMARTTASFKQITAQSQESIVRVDAEVQTAVDLAKDMADRAGVRLIVEPPDQMLVTRARAAHVQHVLLNTLINAIQQIGLVRPKGKGNEGCVRIRFDQRRSKSGAVLAIIIEDDGPGIHQRHFERVFNLGFSTRPNEGSGLGLYIAQQIVLGMDGRLYIADSAMLWGTTFVIELPILLK